MHSELFIPYPPMQYISHRKLLLSEKSNWANLKKKIFRILEYIHLLCRFLVASWEEQFACQIITRNPLPSSATSCFPWVRGQIVQYLIDMLNHINSAGQKMLRLCKTPEFCNKIPAEFIFFIKRKKKKCLKVKMHNWIKYL